MAKCHDDNGFRGAFVSSEHQVALDDEQTEVGSYFVATYPPFSVWNRESVDAEARPALAQPAAPDVPLGLYLHIPFCRKRCHFCYFRVYTDKNADDVQAYLDLLVKEWELYARAPAVAGRPLSFVYFGGGTPSFLSTRQLETLVSHLSTTVAWDRAEEVTFECEPGTLTPGKLAAIRRIGVTRLSLGIESFDDDVLALNGRAHRTPEIFRSYEEARALDFPQVNIDLIAGMLGQTAENWTASVRKTLELQPDSITIYQMELPYNTTISRNLLKSADASHPVASWPQKRQWVREAFDTLERAGYHVGSAYTAAREPSKTRFVYRDRLWQGADMVGLGVASFGHVNGVHMQNADTWELYGGAVAAGKLPLSRAYRPTGDERLIRELVLQLKLGSIRPAYFSRKYGVDLFHRFAGPFASLTADGYLARADADMVALTREGLLRVDALVRRFFNPEHAGIRYT
jgi:oxygen-independent coproporphyrinogen-3 oxidase